MNIKIALAGNPNSGKTTLFNSLTGSNQFVGNWPGVTVEKKEGKMKGHDDVIFTDLPGIYSLSPYTLEEVVSRNYLINENPDAILNIVDGTNLERNLYLTTQLLEIGIPVVIAINMMDVVEKNGDKIDTEALGKKLGCKVVTISALKETGITEAAKAAIDAARNGRSVPHHIFSGEVEHALAHIEEATIHELAADRQRWYAIKIFERDERVIKNLKISPDVIAHIEHDIRNAEDILDDDAEGIIANERYNYISSITKDTYKKHSAGSVSVSEKIDKVVTNRFLALPIFALVMFLIYYISVSTIGTWVTDWTNDGLFGDGWHLFGIGSSEYEEAANDYAENYIFTDSFVADIEEAAEKGVTGTDEILEAIEEKDFGAFDESFGSYADALEEAGYSVSDHYEAVMEEAPDTSEYGVWVPGIPGIVEKGLEAAKTPDWLNGLILDGIVGGVGAVLGFVPQLLVLFIFLAFLEGCGYMARIAFMMDKIFRKFGLSGKSFIPMLIGTGCSVPGIMASRTIENETDRRMTIMTTSFIPCGAKIPIIALIATSLFGGAWWVAPSAYFIGVAAVMFSGIILKKTKLFAGDVAPFVMELPAYHMPTFKNVMRSMWERGSSFIRKAGTIILLASVIIWAGSTFGWTDGAFGFNAEMELADSVLGKIGNALCIIFAPLGFGTAEAAVATIMGLVAKEEIVGVFGVLGFAGMTKLAAYSFLIFNLLCAPCFAAMGAMKREMNNGKWTAFAIIYQCVFAYAVSLTVYQIGSAIMGSMSIPGIIAAAIVVVIALFMLLRRGAAKK